ncbi:MAG: CsbD family protein [Chloroflexi bacterium]|nr:CsbD family protein [Chloroflexota bacterium]
MADQHVKGAVSTVKGTVNEGVGKLTGDRKQEAKGKVQKVQGKAQDGLGDVQDAVHKDDHD